MIDLIEENELKNLINEYQNNLLFKEKEDLTDLMDYLKVLLETEEHIIFTQNEVKLKKKQLTRFCDKKNNIYIKSNIRGYGKIININTLTDDDIMKLKIITGHF